jgi:flagellin
VANSASDILGFSSGGVGTWHYGSNAGAADDVGSVVAATLDVDQGLTNQLKIKIDGAGAQTITLTGGSRSATDVVGEINSQLTGGTAYLDGSGNLKVKVNATGAGHSVEIVAANANTAFTFTPTGSASSGVNAQAAVETGATVGATFAVQPTVNDTLLVNIDGSGDQTVTLAGGSLTDAQIVSSINNQITGGTAFIDTAGKIAIASNTTGLAGSSVHVTGTAATALGFTGATAHGTDQVTGYTVGASNDTLTVSVDGQTAQSITLAHGTGLTAGAVATDIQTKLQALGGAFADATAAADATTHVITISSGTTGTDSKIAVSVSTNDAATTLGFHEGTQYLGTAQDVGYGTGGASFTGNTASAPNDSVLNSGGATSTGPLSFTALKYGSDSQAISISATDSSGQMQSATITLANDNASRTGRSLDETIAAINTALQQTNVKTLQSIVAVKDHTSAEQIDFISSLAAFQVSVGSTGSGSGIGSQGSTAKATTLAGGSSLDISSQLGGTAAISALTNAVSALGAAQANVGKAQNTLNYAIGLAQSQTANLSAAESRIRDADMASEAANLTKAQVLQQSAIAAMVQANSAPQAVLTLLRG